MTSYKKGEMTRREYLVQMGAVSLKSQRELKKRGINDKNKAPARRPVTLPSAFPSAGAALEDSFSETRVMSPQASDQDSDVDQFDPFPVRVRDPQRAIRPIVEARRKAQKCTKCNKGFQLRKNLHLICDKCGGYQHKRCSGVAKHRDPFMCLDCVPDTILDEDLGEKLTKLLENLFKIYSQLLFLTLHLWHPLPPLVRNYGLMTELSS